MSQLISPEPEEPLSAHQAADKLEQQIKRLPLRTLLLWLGGLLLCVVALELFFELAENVVYQVAHQTTDVPDIAILTFMQTLHSPVLDVLAFTLSDMVYYPIVIGVTLVVSWLWIRYGQVINAITLIVLTAGASMIDTALKDMYRRPRPVQYFYLNQPTDFSFPSGHSLVGVVFYLGLIYLLTRYRPARVRVIAVIIALLLALGIAASRVYFGVHYPTDVLGGLTVGILWFLFIIGGSALWYHRTPDSPSPQTK